MSEVGALGDSREKVKPSVPNVVYDESLKDKQVPYSVSVDASAFGDLMKQYGMSDEKIRGITIKVKRKSLPGRLGAYYPLTRTVELYMDESWEKYQKYLSKIDSIIAGDVPPNDDAFKGLLKTKRMAKYLSQAPSERGREFATRMLQEATDRKLSTTGIHEGKHALDTQNAFHVLLRSAAYGAIIPAGYNIYQFTAEKLVTEIFHLPAETVQSPSFLLTGLSFAFGIYVFSSIFDPYEIRADKFEKLVYKNPKLASLVTIRPKDTSEKTNSS